MDNMSCTMFDQAQILADRHTSQLVRYSQTVGVVYLGGLGSRRFFDFHSDIDIAVFVEEEAVDYLPPFSFYVPMGASEVEFNVTQHVCPVDPENCTEYWGEARRSAYRNGRVVFDRQGRVGRLIKRCCTVSDSTYRDTAAVALNQIQWRGIHHARACWERGYAESAHSLINDAYDLAIQVVFCLNRADRPHRKWVMREFANLPTVPDGLRELLCEASLVAHHGATELRRRMEAVSKIRDILFLSAHAAFSDFPIDPYRHWARHVSGRQLDPNNPVDVICDALAPNHETRSMRLLRGRLSEEIMRQPATLAHIAAASSHDDFAAVLLAALGPDLATTCEAESFGADSPANIGSIHPLLSEGVQQS